MKNIKKISNLSIAGLLAIGVLALGYFAYQSKIQADTILPGYATAHVGLNVTVPDARSIPFAIRFTPVNGGANYYFKNRSFTFETAGLNTVEWYIRKIPQGQYRVTLYSANNELSGSPVEVNFINDQVNETAEFELNLGEPSTEPGNSADSYTTPVAEESIVYESPTTTQTPAADTTQTGTIVTPGDLQIL